MDTQQTKSPSLVTDLQINLRICQHAFKFPPDTVLNKNSWDTNRCFFSFSCSPCPSQSCLSRFSHQTLYTNIEGTRRHKSVPTILTETVASFMCVYNYCVVWYNGKYIYFFLARIYFRRYWIYTAVQSTDPLSADQLRNL